MKRLVSLLLISIILISCETTQEPKKDTDFQLIGAVSFNLKKYSESGQYVSDFSSGHYLAKTKIELLSGNNVMEVTYPVADSTCDIFYILKNVEFNTPYKIRMTLKDLFTQDSEEFSITESDIKIFPYDSITENYVKGFDWFEKGRYYSDLLWNTEKLPGFNLYTDESVLSVFPNPIINKGSISYMVKDTSWVEITINGLNEPLLFIVFRGLAEPGTYQVEFGENLADGLYYIQMISGAKTNYCPFLKGSKGGPGEHRCCLGNRD